MGKNKSLPVEFSMKILRNLVLNKGFFIIIFILHLLISLVSVNICYGKGDSDEKIELFINYAYENDIGTGGYNIAGLSGRFIKIPLGYAFKFGNNDRWGLRIRTTFFYGRYEFDITTEDSAETAKIDTLSAVPGLELIIPVIDKHKWTWFLKPFVDLGLGWQINTNEPPAVDITVPINYIYDLGSKSLLSFGVKNFTFGLGNQFSFGGNSTFDHDFGESFVLVKNGIEVRHPLGFSVKGFTPDASVFFIYYLYLPDLEIAREDRRDLVVDDQIEISFTIGSDEPFKLLILNNPRIGLGYRFGDGVKALVFTFRFPF